MKLRDALGAAVARCTPLQMQHATFPGNDATGGATIVQPMPANPHEIRLSSATAGATGMQQGAKTYATFDPEIQAESCIELHRAGRLTAHRVTADLLSEAMRVCDRHGDSDAKRQEMRDKCLALPPHLQADLLEHFRGVRHGTE